MPVKGASYLLLSLLAQHFSVRPDVFNLCADDYLDTRSCLEPSAPTVERCREDLSSYTVSRSAVHQSTKYKHSIYLQWKTSLTLKRLKTSRAIQ